MRSSLWLLIWGPVLGLMSGAVGGCLVYGASRGGGGYYGELRIWLDYVLVGIVPGFVVGLVLGFVFGFRGPAMSIPADWLKEPLSLEGIEAKLKRHTNHPGWQHLKSLVQPGDEFWSFRSPSTTWPKKLGAAGYALVREGVPIASFTIMRS